jgi:hypothetical protein
VPELYVGKRVHVRLDRSLVRISYQRKLIKTHPRAPDGGRQTDDHDFTSDKQIYARRDTEALQKLADHIGVATGAYAARIIESPAPWRRMRAVYRLLGLARRYGGSAVEEACRLTLELDVIDVTRVQRIVERALEHQPSPEPKPPQPDNVVHLRFARPASHFALTTREDK